MDILDMVICCLIGVLFFQSAVLGGNQVVGHQGTSLSGREAKSGERAPDGYFWEGVSKGYAVTRHLLNMLHIHIDIL